MCQVVIVTASLVVVQRLHVELGEATAGRLVLKGSSSNAKRMKKFLDMSIVVCSRIISCYEAL